MLIQSWNAWQWLMDEVVPHYTKERYSPDRRWKGKPFVREDVLFFLKGIQELSMLFTQERSRKVVQYLSHPRYRSAYLLYFLPLQSAKFLLLFQENKKAMDAVMAHARQQGVLRVFDLGAGPGTASLSLLLALLDRSFDPIPIEFYWCDLQKDILQDGQQLMNRLIEKYAQLFPQVEIRFFVKPWWKMDLRLFQEASLVLMGHVLNEAILPAQQLSSFWSGLLERVRGGGVCFVEPADRQTSQKLSILRDGFLERGLLKKSGIWGPCLHAGECPLASGRDWCHWSTPFRVSGVWWNAISRMLNSEKNWMKYSYLWVGGSVNAEVPQKWRKVVSDALEGDGRKSVLLCEPHSVLRWSLSRDQKALRRGEIISIDHGEVVRGI